MGRSSCDLIDYVRGAPDGVYGARDGTGGGGGVGSKERKVLGAHGRDTLNDNGEVIPFLSCQAWA